MKLIATQFGYHYLQGVGRAGKPIFDLLPDTENPSTHPESGYYSSGYICRVKGVPNLFEPTEVTKKQIAFRNTKP